LVMRHFDWTRPDAPLEQEVDGTQDDDGELDGSSLGPARFIYQHDSRPITFSEYDASQRAFGANDSEAQRTLRRERHRAPARTAGGASNVIGIETGRIIEISGHWDASLDGRWLVVQATHTCMPDSPYQRYVN